jgi:galactonate dehydratase
VRERIGAPASRRCLHHTNNRFSRHMNAEIGIDSITLSIARVTPSTHWTFVEIVDEENRIGLGEATLTGRDSELLRAASDMFPAIVDMRVDDAASWLDTLELGTIARAAVASALSHAVTDLRARIRNRSIAELLGHPVRAFIPMYANINRRTHTRSPDSFAHSARSAVAAGFSAVKIAPFDGVTLYGNDAHAQPLLIDAALERIAAVRDAVGPAVDVMVDCHWRLNAHVARQVLASDVCDGLHWLECPLPETPDRLHELRALRSLANDRGIRLAGCEEAIRAEGFMPFVEAGAYDVMMPDVKYVGSVDEMLHVAQLLGRHDVEFSPHNPSGPVAHAVSMQICSLVPNFRRMEMQFDETPYFHTLTGATVPVPDNGGAPIARTSGIGMRLDRDALDPLTIRRLQFHRACRAGELVVA